MFNQEPNKTSLIIVCDDKTKAYATFLQQLVGQNDDYGDIIVGVKDGTVSAAIWSTKVYEDNLAELTSNSRVVFIGSSETSKEQGRNVKFTFCKYGMNYGWLGKRAVLYVDNRKHFTKKEYDKFLSFCKHSYKQFEISSSKTTNTKPYAAALIGAAFLPVSLPVFGFATAGIVSAVALSNQKKKIRDQQFRCLIMEFYMNGLRSFLEE